MRALKSIANYIKRTDKLYWLLMILISSYSLLLMKTVPSPEGRTMGYFTTMLVAVIGGFVGAFLFSFIDYREITNFWYVVAGFCLFLIIYTQLFGSAVVNSGGVNAKAWIYLPGGLTFQPSELVKIGFILTFSKHLSALEERSLLKSPVHIVLLALHAMVPVVLVHFQGDDGTAVIFFCMFLAMSFGAGIQLRYFAALMVSVGVAFPLAWKYVLKDYQKERLLVTYRLDSDPNAALQYAYQQIQGRLSIGSGGLWGRGLFQSPRVNRSIVPVQQSDFVFSVAGEQLGFIGCTAIMLLLLLYLLHTLRVARKSTDLLGSCICMGFFGMIAAQAVFNLGMCLDLLPVMGVTLPFFSYGGSSAICLYFGFGLVLNVYMHRVNTDKVVLKRRI
ncbi:putative lipid II flippase FtsW [Caprobacter fermentans]|uniref:FtsW/RodA/SpoVE family cell cycle protein n=1 Tax=Caproicibacter fermentans TaxID=2576756 RepID=A0A6N8I264_9FIRM|nr:FtsW/RodA/SpoVE family cell cycle protein [Caproicibacter fermentans]MVB11847.1 putative lipid II flippase FtsW [Caproicibacter fermentans]OCN00649.1 cell division protein [Clostridium sp. W14A]QNK41087.1 FtsW/RodA/SpoVE family cell cycle protein [Caproicibacter fermentans]